MQGALGEDTMKADIKELAELPRPSLHLSWPDFLVLIVLTLPRNCAEAVLRSSQAVHSAWSQNRMLWYLALTTWLLASLYIGAVEHLN
jgi:hypothetical protein